MRKIISYLKSLDSLGPTINFRIEKKDNFQTVFGGLLSLCSVCLYIYLFIVFGIDFMQKKNPIVIFQNYDSDIYQNLTLNPKEILFSWRLVDDKNTFNLSDIFETNISIIEYKIKNNTYEYTPLNFSTCDKVLEENITSYNANLNSSEIYCIDFSNIKENYIGGFWNNDYNRYINIDFYPKYLKNSSNDKVDLNKTIFNSFYSGRLLLEIFIKQSFIDVNNFENPLKNTIFYSAEYLGNKMNKKILMFFQETVIETDYGFIGEDIRRKNNIGFNYKNLFVLYSDKDAFSFNYKNSNEDYLNISLFNGKNITYITRKYMKLQELLGNISGFMQIINIIFVILSKFYSEFRINKYVASEFVFFIDKEKYIGKEHIEKKNISVPSHLNRVELKNYKGMENKFNMQLNTDKIRRYYINPNFSEIDSKSHVSMLKKNNFSNEFNFKMEENKKIHTLDDIFEKGLDLAGDNIEDKINLKALRKFKFEKNRHIFDYSLFDFYCPISKRKIKNNSDINSVYAKISQNVNEKIMKKIDLFYYLKLTNTIDYMKKIIFEEKLLNFIDYISEKCYYYDKFDGESNIKLNDFSAEKKLEFNKMIETARSINKSERKSEYTKKIIQSLKKLLDDS